MESRESLRLNIMEEAVKHKISDVIAKITQRKVVVWCGAGLSVNSGLPVATKLERLYLSKLSKESSQEILDSGLPFEVVMKCLSSVSNLQTILRVLNVGKPNLSHMLFAKLAKLQYLQNIVTTNQDMLFEAALEQEGLVRGKHFVVLFKDEHFSEATRTDAGKTIILKLHGSIEDTESVKITLEQVASKQLSESRRRTIESVFSNGEHETVLILGYSCSDEFDISPLIRNIEHSDKEIIIIQHKKYSERMEDIRLSNDKNPFKTFQGKRIYIDTDKFIDLAWELLNDFRSDFEKPRIEPVDIREINKMVTDLIEHWHSSLRKGEAELATAQMFTNTGYYRKAREYCLKALELAKATENDPLRSMCYSSLFSVHLGLQENRVAKEYLLKGARMAGSDYFRQVLSDEESPMDLSELETGNKKIDIASISLDKADVARLEANYARAEYYYKVALEALQALEKADPNRDMSFMYFVINLGLAKTYVESNNLENAETYSNYAFSYAQTEGFLEECIDSLMILSKVSLKRGLSRKAICNAEEALQLSKKIGNKNLQINCIRDLINIYRNLREPAKIAEYEHELTRSIKER